MKASIQLYTGGTPDYWHRWNRAHRGAYFKGVYAAIEGENFTKCPYKEVRKDGEHTLSRSFRSVWRDGYKAAKEHNKYLDWLRFCEYHTGYLSKEQKLMIAKTKKPTQESFSFWGVIQNEVTIYPAVEMAENKELKGLDKNGAITISLKNQDRLIKYSHDWVERLGY